MKILTPAQMRAADRRAIKTLGVPSSVLMDRAGRAVAEVAEAAAEGERAAVLAGPGNNGGDGLVAARYLMDAGFEVDAFLLAPAAKLSADARVNYELFKKCGGRVARFERRRFSRAAKAAGVIVDAMLGTGGRGGLEGDFRDAAWVANKAGAPVVAVDVPSGIDAASGAVPDVAVEADATVTLAFPKLGLMLFPARRHAGEIFVADVGYPQLILDELAFDAGGNGYGYVARVPAVEEIAALLPPRPLNLHKGAAGRGYVLAGSRGMSGAAILAAKSFLRAGGGLARVGLPAELDTAFSAAAVECLSQPLPANDKGGLTADGAPAARSAARAADAVAIGPGLGQHADTAALVNALTRNLRKPVVVDADGLYLLGLANLARLRLKGVLTPHAGEMARLFGLSAADVEADRLKWARELAARTGMAVVLKGYLSVVAAPGEEPWLNPTGSAGLASGGTGDVLTGVILAFLAAGMKPAAAARAGAYTHGLAADIAAEHCGERALIASDVLDALPAAFKVLADDEAAGDPGWDRLWASYY